MLHSKNYISKFTKIICNLEQRKELNNNYGIYSDRTSDINFSQRTLRRYNATSNDNVHNIVGEKHLQHRKLSCAISEEI